MSALDKLINLLEHLKETSPDMHDKANKALDVLLDEEALVEEVEEEVSEEVSNPKYVIRGGKLISGDLDLEPEPEPEPEPEIDDSYFEIEEGDIDFIISVRTRLKELISSLGLLLQAYEVDKERLLDEIELAQSALNKKMEELQSAFPLDPESGYTLVFPNDNQTKGAFIKNDPS